MQVCITLFPKIDPTHPKLLPLIAAANTLTSVDDDIDDEMQPKYLLDLIISGGEACMLHVQARAFAPSAEKALAAVRAIWDAARAGNTAMLSRREPKAETQRDFSTKSERHQGYCRFTVLDHEGEIARPLEPGSIVGFGAR